MSLPSLNLHPMTSLRIKDADKLAYVPEFFRDIEFNTATPRCSISDMDPKFLEKLDNLRRSCGFPLSVNCFYRSEEWDKKHGRSGQSYHCRGRAADIRCFDSYKRACIVHNAALVGLNGIGVYKTFIHVDDRPVSTLWYGEVDNSSL